MISSKRIRLMGQFDNDNHLSTWDTRNTSTGSSNSDQIKIPTESDGTYNCTIFWGDGNYDAVTTWDDSAWTHTYSVSGEYQIQIVGQCEGFRFYNEGDKFKLLSIENGGEDFSVGNNGKYFYGCENLLYINNVDFSGTTNFNRAFMRCFVFNSNINFNDPVSNIVDTFWDCRKFNSKFYNLDLSVTSSLGYCLYKCYEFNQDISNLNYENIDNMINMLTYSTSFSTENYDKLLLACADQNVKTGVTFNCSSYYTLGGAAETARNYLINTKGWSVTDLGGV